LFFEFTTDTRSFGESGRGGEGGEVGKEGVVKGYPGLAAALVFYLKLMTHL